MITAIKVAVVLLVIIVGLFYIDTDNYSPYIPPSEPGSTGEGIHQSLFSYVTGAGGSTFGWYGLLAAASLVFFAFIGFDVVATTAEEAKEPQKALPRGILGSLLIVTVLYVAVTLVLTGMVKYTELEGDTSNLATAFAFHDITWAKNVISFGALAGLTTVVMVLMLGQTRVLFAMARDGLMPRRLAPTGKHGTPVRITILVGVVVAVLAGVFPIGTLEEMVNIGTLFAFVLVSSGGSRASSDAAGPTPRVQGATGPADPDPGCPRVSLVDVQPVGGDLDEVRGLDGPRCCHLLRLQQAAFVDREA